MSQALFLVSTALHSLAQHKGRSLLTITSIIVGIAAVVATLAIGKGAEEKIRRRINAMGNNFLYVQAGNDLNTGATNLTKKQSIHLLKTSDQELICKLCPQITHASPVNRLPNKIVSYKNNRVIAPIIGCNPTLFHISNRCLALGRFFNKQEEEEHASVIVLGSDAAAELFKGVNPLGKVVRLKQLPFVVIGVLGAGENFSSFQNKNMELFVPFSTSKRKLSKTPLDQTTSIALSVSAPEDTPQVERTIRSALRNRHHLSANDSDDFTIWNQQGMSQAAQETSATFNLFLLIIASLSLLVGGIGVMNIMLVSVTERTKEIGIRMALGATQANILQQFLIESIVLCCVGGLLGICLGVTAPVIIARCIGWEVIITPASIILSLGITTLIGVFFGYWPARKASRLAIVEALIDR